MTWVSTQPNLLTVGFLRDLVDQLGSKETIGGYSRAQLDAIPTMGDALLANTLVTDSSTTAYFKQGIDDGQEPLDVQALGAMYLKLRGDSRATKVANTITSRFYASGRGYRPFYGTGAPDVMWSEGTIEASVALSRLGIASPATDSAVIGIAGTVEGSTTGPIGADRDVVSPVWGEYHTWATSAAASWLLIRFSPTQYLLSR